MSGSNEGLSQSLKEAIVGAIVKAGIEDADGVIKILEDLRKMKKKMCFAILQRNGLSVNVLQVEGQM